ncbi:hypothetical protein A2771_02215 [Candidatus Woesebacteria bacterium RIFCSPHIGHO2_01_FULL_38_26b]|uniref:YYY membrane protein n=1 Tax=Candidatus Woesebacteria bacterium RIFCSPHIGHO2_01_FULL_38_26b TaxID=1802491 RepID=A0A1F7XVI0_9BACT|nr:MAG: hypothetical protein A2771_02215 [Candidatus Woesebacteria bacterium RIFCSPHIGHO2_01_FULL_38_26b]
MFSSDVNFIFLWWIIYFIVGLVNFPVAYLIFKKFTDLGYGFTKTFAFVIITYLVFLTSIFRILPFTRTSIFVTVLILLCLNVYIFTKNKKEIISDTLKKIKVLIFQEMLFTFGLVTWSVVRGYQPDINGLEKFMDYGFINSILRTKFLPPSDMWFAGKAINYYWFGHLWTAISTKLTNIPPAITYNLMLATILGLALTSAFSISSTLVKNLKLKAGKKAIFAAGIISAFVLVFGGNFHTPFYVLKDGGDKYWYPDATRFIGYNPDVEDKTIHEFPMYSFVVSDLHPHLINFPFVLLFIGLLLNFALDKKLNNKNLILPGFLLGIFFMTNTWDFANYLLVSGYVVLVLNYAKIGFKLKTLYRTFISLGQILIIGLIVAIPFILNFESIAEGVAFVRSRSPIWQLSILWGFPTVLTLIFALTIIKNKPKLKGLSRSDLLTIAILFSSWTLIFLPEVIYVKDIYIASHHRANTMFKLTYQAFVMFYTLSGFIAIRTLLFLKKRLAKLAMLTFLTIIFGSILTYPSYSVKSYYADLKVYKGISGEEWLKSSHPEIFQVVSWFRNNVSGQPNILEAPGDSYTEYNVISSYTGLPTVSGWFVHEWLWRGDAKFPQERVAEIDQIYNSTDVLLVKDLLSKYKVEYVIVGEFERLKFPYLTETKFTNIGQVVFRSGTTTVYDVLSP